MKKLIILLLMSLSFTAYSQIDTSSTYRTPIPGQPVKIIKDRRLWVNTLMGIPFTNSTTPTLNGGVDLSGMGLQLLSDNALAISRGGGLWNKYYPSSGTNTGDQTLSVASIATTPGGLSISGQNTVQMASLFLNLATVFPNANTPPSIAGFYPYINTGSTNYPTTAGAGFTVARSNASAVGMFQFNKTTSSDDELWFRVGLTSSTYGAWDRVAGRTWVVSAMQIVNTTTTALSSATLNSTYGSVPVGYRVICHLITGAPAIYTKATENGSSDVWLTTTATITP